MEKADRSTNVRLPKIPADQNLYDQKVNFSQQNKDKLKQLNEKKRQQAQE